MCKLTAKPCRPYLHHMVPAGQQRHGTATLACHHVANAGPLVSLLTGLGPHPARDTRAPWSPPWPGPPHHGTTDRAMKRSAVAREDCRRVAADGLAFSLRYPVKDRAPRRQRDSAPAGCPGPWGREIALGGDLLVTWCQYLLVELG